MTTSLPKIIVILGPTASGKTDLAIALAREFNGEIISADSRQVYKKMTIATGKPAGKWKRVDDAEAYVVEGIPHYLMDMVDPGADFTLAQFKESALSAIRHIRERGKIPFLVGGTGLYIWSIVDNLSIPRVAPNKQLRRGFERKSPSELAALLAKIDPATAEKIDLKNKRRVLRALEVAILSGQSLQGQQTKGAPVVAALQIGLNHPRAELRDRIDNRVKGRVKGGMIAETERLLKQKYDWALPSLSGLGYREIHKHLQGELSLAEAIEVISGLTRRYARRQLTWFKRDPRIHWLKEPDLKAARVLIADFLAS